MKSEKLHALSLNQRVAFPLHATMIIVGRGVLG